jgi:hypothetical protein
LFLTSVNAETVVPCKISILEGIDAANVTIYYNNSVTNKENFTAQSLEELLKIVSTHTSKKNIEEKKNDNNNIELTEVCAPKTFFPKIKAGTTLVDIPGFSETNLMKNINISYLSQEKYRSIFVFLIPLGIGGSLLKENTEILDVYKTKDKDLTKNILFVLTKLSDFENNCLNENSDFEEDEEEKVKYMSDLIFSAYIKPIKEKFPSANIFFYEIGKKMQNYIYDKESLQLSLKNKNTEKSESSISVGQESLDAILGLINNQLRNNEELSLNWLKNKAISRINKSKKKIFNFHNEDKQVKKNKIEVTKCLKEITKKYSEECIAEYKLSNFNKQRLNEIINEKITQESLGSKEKHQNIIEADVWSISISFLTRVVTGANK